MISLRTFFFLPKVLSIVCLYKGVKSLNTVFIRGEGSWGTWYNGCTLERGPWLDGTQAVWNAGKVVD